MEKKVQKIKFVICPYCGAGQHSIPKIGELITEVVCIECKKVFDPYKDISEYIQDED